MSVWMMIFSLSNIAGDGLILYYRHQEALLRTSQRAPSVEPLKGSWLALRGFYSSVEEMQGLDIPALAAGRSIPIPLQGVTPGYDMSNSFRCIGVYRRAGHQELRCVISRVED